MARSRHIAPLGVAAGYSDCFEAGVAFDAPAHPVPGRENWNELDSARERDRKRMAQDAAARQAGKRRAYVLARAVTQASILAMALLAVSPIVTHVSMRIWQGAEASPLWMRGLTVLCGLSFASFALTSTLRKHWEADDGLPQ